MLGFGEFYSMGWRNNAEAADIYHEQSAGWIDTNNRPLHGCGHRDFFSSEYLSMHLHLLSYPCHKIQFIWSKDRVSVDRHRNLLGRAGRPPLQTLNDTDGRWDQAPIMAGRPPREPLPLLPRLPDWRSSSAPRSTSRAWNMDFMSSKLTRLLGR